MNFNGLPNDFSIKVERDQLLFMKRVTVYSSYPRALKSYKFV